MFAPLRQEEDVRRVAGLGLQHLVPAAAQQARHGAVRVREVAEGERPRRAGLDARGISPLADAVDAERALVDEARRVDVAGAVGARGDARLAAGALRLRHRHDAALADVRRARGAGVDAGRGAAVVAALGADLHGEAGEGAAHLLDDPVPEAAVRKVVLGLAGDDAGVAAHAAGGVDRHGVALLRADLLASSMRTKFTFMPVPPMMGSTL